MRAKEIRIWIAVLWRMMVPTNPLQQPLPLKRLAELRQQVPAWQASSAEALRELRDAE